jgi:hypothetical protein
LFVVFFACDGERGSTGVTVVDAEEGPGAANGTVVVDVIDVVMGAGVSRLRFLLLAAWGSASDLIVSASTTGLAASSGFFFLASFGFSVSFSFNAPPTVTLSSISLLLSAKIPRNPRPASANRLAASSA